MTGRAVLPVALVAVALSILLPAVQASQGEERPAQGKKQEKSSKKTKGDPNVKIHYLEIVTDAVDALCDVYGEVHGLEFGAEDADLGQARAAVRKDGTLVGIRKPLAEHEQPTMRTYLEVDDIQAAVKKAEAAGAMIAYPPTKQGARGTFAIFIHGGVQHGLWQE